VDGGGNIYVTDDRHDRLLKLSSDGALLSLAGQGGTPASDVFQSPKGVAAGAGGVYVADAGERRVMGFDGNLRQRLSFSGAPGNDGFKRPVALAAASDGRLFVADPLRSSVLGFGAPGTPAAALAAFASFQAPAETFSLGQAYSFPNPARNGVNPTLHVETGAADRVRLRVYDLAGALLEETALSGPPTVNIGGQPPAYEYTWDASRVPSGVYLWVVQAEKDGHQSLKTTSKVAVIK
jgi:hypothetical protein